MMLLKEFALFASTKAFIPLINILPNAAVPCAIASNCIALLVLEPYSSYLVFSLDITGPLELGRSTVKVMLILRSNLAFTFIMISISCK